MRWFVPDPNWEHGDQRKRRVWAWVPTKMDDGSVVWLGWYLQHEWYHKPGARGEWVVTFREAE